MKYLKIPIFTLPLLFFLIFFSCDNGDGNGGFSLKNYIPNEDGYYWTYNVEDNYNPESFTRTTTVNGTRDIGGTTCQIMEDTSTINNNINRTFFTDNDTNTLSIYGYENENEGQQYPYYFTNPIVYYYPYVIGAKVVLLNEEGISPTDFPFFGFPDDDIDNDGVDDTIDAVVEVEILSLENVNVPAGQFEDCFKIFTDGDLLFHLSLLGDYNVAMDIYSWFKPYTGRVKDTRAIDFNIPGFENYTATSELTSYFVGQ
jgi:hypothetical protein